MEDHERLVHLETENTRLRQAVDGLTAELDALREREAANPLQVGKEARKLEEALRRLDGLQSELEAQHQKNVAVLQVLDRITSHRWYRFWDRVRRITGKPALHGRRDDPIGIQSGMPM